MCSYLLLLTIPPLGGMGSRRGEHGAATSQPFPSPPLAGKGRGIGANPTDKSHAEAKRCLLGLGWLLA